MPKVSADKLQPGMILMKPVLNKAGIVLLGEGTELTETWVRRIQDMELTGIWIDGPELPQIPKEQLLAELDERFEQSQDKPYMADLKRIIRQHIEGLYE